MFPRRSAGDGLLSPVPLFALGALLANDHLWKMTHPGIVTGKLSDVAGLVFFPLLLQAAWEMASAVSKHSWRPSRPVLNAAVLATGIVFTLVKTIPAAGTCYRMTLGALQWPAYALSSLATHAPLPLFHPVTLTQDPTDLLALPALALALWIGTRRCTTSPISA